MRLLSWLALTAPIVTASSVRLQVDASWRETNLLVQILESIAIQDDAAFWPLLDVLTDHTKVNPNDTPAELYANAFKEIQHTELLTSPSIALLRLSIANKEASPKVQAFYQIYSSSNYIVSAACRSFVQLPSGTTTCDTEELTRSFQALHEEVLPVVQLPFDHVTPSSGPTYILLGDPTDPHFHALHSLLIQASQQDNDSIKYILRWKPDLHHDTATKLRLSGYGAALDIKKSDYLAVDDRQLQNKEQTSRNDTVRNRSLRFGDTSVDIDVLEPLSRSDLKDLGAKASQFIMQSSKPLDTLVHLSQDFPKYAHTLANDWVPDVSDDLQARLEVQQTQIEPGQNMIWLNGLRLTERDMEPFALIRRLREEQRLVAKLMKMNLSARQAVTLLSQTSFKSKQASQMSPGPLPQPETLGMLFDASDRNEGNNAILWWNDLERDKRYKNWPTDLLQVLQPRYGQMPQIRKNLWNLVFVLDLSQTQSLGYIVQYIMPFIQRNLPFHVGLVPLIDVNNGVSLQMARLLLYMLDNFSKIDAMSLIYSLLESPTSTFNIADVQRVYTEIVKSKGGQTKDASQPLDFGEIIKAYGQKRIDNSQLYSRRLGIRADTVAGAAFLNGRYINLDKNFQYNLQTSMSQQQTYLQVEAYMNRLNGSEDALHYFYDLPTVYKRRNPLIFESDTNPLTVIQIEECSCPSGWVGEDSSETSIYLFSDDVALTKAALSAQHASPEIMRICTMPPNDAKYPFHEASSSFLIINGRLIKHLTAEMFDANDIINLVNYEIKTRLEPIKQSFKILDVSPSADQLAVVTSVLVNNSLPNPNDIWVSSTRDRTNEPSLLSNNMTTFSAGDDSEAWARFEAVIDPISETAAKYCTIVSRLLRMDGVSVTIHLNPVGTISELPVKRFYRHSFASELFFNGSGEIEETEISFNGMPTAVLLTLALETQSSWLAFPSRSVHDLDNIRLADLTHRDAHVEATFELENIIVEGHCSDMTNGGQPPRGLQLILESAGSANTTVDSIVMSNLGYVQLKANPGSFDLSIRTTGHGREVFDLTSDSSVYVTTLEGTTLLPQFTRKIGQETIDLLDLDEADTSTGTTVLSRIQKFFGKSQAIANANQVATINVFTVASGLLYERMALIMIVSVLRHTESKVKFWFISNFLSPSFKSFIPHMAKEYGFDYEMVTYKWPHWLRSQKEKQRTIWGYKILFLDVLFPLELDRVIFVDSDQIVRTDLKQLIELDLQGAPYGYTPMCDSRTEMEGFRFWKTGYWRDHLRGRPYHISALYVIDLNRFRKMAAGDRLRGQYQALSADPHSLANLDQDLPNNMQMQIPIYSLDQSWLWCQTWCSDESFAEAKTIDLCNNPMTHEPKLLRAKRIVPEWTEYDNEIADLARRVAEATHEAIAFEGDSNELEQAKLQQEEFKEEGKPGAKEHLAGEL